MTNRILVCVDDILHSTSLERTLFHIEEYATLRLNKESIELKVKPVPRCLGLLGSLYQKIRGHSITGVY